MSFFRRAYSFTQKPTINGILKLLFFLVVLVFSVYGRPIPLDKDIYAEINRFTVRPYKHGVYITELPFGYFYNFSAYDSYYKDENGEEHRLMQQDPQIVSEESRLRYQNQSFRSKFFSILSYFDITNPTATFNTEQGKIILKATPEEQKIHFSLYEVPQDLIKSENLTLTLSFNEEDIIFDYEGNLYTDNTEETIEEFTELSGFRLTRLENTGPKIGVKYKQYLFIANKDTNGLIALDLSNKNYSDSFVNLEKGLIELDLISVENPEITVELYESLESALNEINNRGGDQ